MAALIRALGTQGLHASAMGFGAMGLTAFYGEHSTDCVGVQDYIGVRLLKIARNELGINLIDTAEAYRHVDEFGVVKSNEALVGKAARSIGRDRLVICTKHIPGGWESGLRQFRGEKPLTVTSENLRDVVRNSCHDSLKELGIDCIDLYYLHRMYPAPITIEQVMQVFDELKAEGKIKYIGLSEAPASFIGRAHAVTPISAVQQEWSLIARDLEGPGGIVDTCRKLGIGIVPYSPVARGFLSGQHQDNLPDDWRAQVPYLSADTHKHNSSVIREMTRLASDKKLSVGQLTLAWVCSRGADVFPIPGTTNILHLKQNAAAASVQLTEAEMRTMEDIARKIKGERGNKSYMKDSFLAYK